jgi:hypothetical protein
MARGNPNAFRGLKSSQVGIVRDSFVDLYQWTG